MLTPSDRVYFIDPLQDVIADNRIQKILVLEELYPRPLATAVNKVIGVKTSRTYEAGRLWFVGDDESGFSGNYVDGALMNPVISYDNALGIHEDGSFSIGATLSHSTRNDRLPVHNVRRSDQKRLAVKGYPHANDTFTQWVKPAAWAYDLMPEANDSALVIEAKLNIAKEKHKARKARVEILRQAAARNWMDDLQDVRDKGVNIPTPRYGGYATGTVYLPVDSDPVRREDLPENVRSNIDLIAEKSGMGVGSRVNQSVGVRTRFPVDVATDSPDNLRGAALTHNVLNSARTHLGVYNLEVGDIHIQPVLRTATNV